MNCTEYGSEKKAKGFLTTPLLHFYLLLAKNLHFNFFGVHYSNIYVLFKLQRIIQTRLEKRGNVTQWTTVKPRFTDTCLIRSPHYYGQFALSLGKKALIFTLHSIHSTVTSLLRTVCFVPGKQSPYIYSTFNPLNTVTSLLRTVCFVPGKESPYIYSAFNLLNTVTSLLRTVCFVPRERKPLYFLQIQPA